MAEKPPAFVVVDKRKFTAEGTIREGYVAPEPEPEPERSTPAEDVDFSSAKVVTMPARTPEATTDATASADDLAGEDMAGSVRPMGATNHASPHAGQPLDGYGASSGRGPETRMSAGQDSDLLEDDLAQEDSGRAESGQDELGDESIGLPRSAAETAAQASAYQQSSRELDAMLQQANPGMQAPGAVGFEHLVQSFYLSAIMAMGAGTEPGQKPRIDILGARQSIDLLTVLEEKTRGNLSAQEQQLLQGITFELRMMFLELTNAISRQAQQPGAPGMGQPGRMPPGGGLR